MQRMKSIRILAFAALAAALLIQAADSPSPAETWRFDRIDRIGSHPVTAFGHPQAIDTDLGTALLFNGVNDALQLDVHPLAGSAIFTWEVIFRPDAGGSEEQRFFHLQERDPTTGRDTVTRMLFEMRVTGDRWCFEGVAFSSAHTRGLIDLTKLHPFGAWYHGAMVYDGHQLRSYLNGALEGEGRVQLAPQGPGHASQGVRIDRRSFFKGALFAARMTPRALAPAEFLSLPHFREHTIGTGLDGGYQVLSADLNHDGKPDLIALSTRLDELVWYENPTWERHVLVKGLAHMINCVPVGADAEGIPEIVLASEFDNLAKNSKGLVSVLHHDGDPRRPWKVTEIDRLNTSHRLRLADIDGSGKPVVINASLTGATAEPPDFRGPTPMVYYRPGIWKRETIQPANEGLVHGLLVLDWDGDGRDEILTAGFTGIQLYKFGKDRQWNRTQITSGAPLPWPKSGSSDLAVGHLGKEPFLAAVEPWHGEQVAVYRLRGGAWAREVIDTSLVDGHTLLAADFDGDGDDELVAGYRGGDHGVLLYRYDRRTSTWKRERIDGAGMAAAACTTVDLKADGRPGIACIGAATANLKWYENLGPQFWRQLPQ